jgi:hypothetical protein
MRSTQISYNTFLSGQYTRKRYVHPVAEYFGDRGARVTSNEFADPELPSAKTPFEDIHALVKSGRRQKFERIDIDIPKTLLRYCLRDASTIMALERVVINVLEREETMSFVVFYPDVIWREATYWHAKSRTSLHPNALSESELHRLDELTQLASWSNADRAIVEKARECQDPDDSIEGSES